MPRRERPLQTSRSEHWLRVAIQRHVHVLNTKVADLFGWPSSESIHWLSPIAADGYAEYYDNEFLKLLGIESPKIPLSSFWPPSGPRWDGLARTSTGRLLLVEAKAHIEEGVTFGSKASEASLSKIHAALDETKRAFQARPDASWRTPFYQYANRLAHLYYLREKNGLDAHLLFLNFADAPDVPSPASPCEWKGATRLVECALGLGTNPYRRAIKTLVWSVPEMLAS